MASTREKGYGVYVNGELKFANVDWNKCKEFADRQVKSFTSHVWLAKVGSFVNV